MTESNHKYHTVIAGLGKTGLTCARHLAAQGIDFAVTDSRQQPPELQQFVKEFPDVPLHLSALDETTLLAAGQILLSPGISLNEPVIVKARAAGIAVFGDIELFCRQVTAPIIAVTGSNGKSTVVSLVTEMIRASGLTVGLGGNIGTPVLQLLQQPVADVYVLELSSFQLETVQSLNAAAAVVLNVCEDHMDRYADLDLYARAKSHAYDGDGLMVLNLDDPYVVSMRHAGRRQLGFSGGEPVGNNLGIGIRDGKEYLLAGQERLIATEELKIKGHHNYLNALAAIALCQALDIPQSAMLEALKNFSGLPHRCQWVTRINGVDWYNDSKGTNVGATCAAIEGLASENNLILIAGGEGKGADFSPLAEIAKGRVKSLVTIGKDGPAIARVLESLVDIQTANDMPAAVNLAAAQAVAGDVVLLSPACASLDMFKDYAERGRVFVDAVMGLKGINDHDA